MRRAVWQKSLHSYYYPFIAKYIVVLIIVVILSTFVALLSSIIILIKKTKLLFSFKKINYTCKMWHSSFDRFKLFEITWFDYFRCYLSTHIAQKLLKCSSGAPNPPRFFVIQKWQDQMFLRNTFLTLPQDSNPIFNRRSNLLRKIVLRTYLGQGCYGSRIH